MTDSLAKASTPVKAEVSLSGGVGGWVWADSERDVRGVGILLFNSDRIGVCSAGNVVNAI